MKLVDILRKRFGHQEFRPLQKQAIQAARKNKDVLIIMPTGAGKSLCFQFPAITLKGVLIVVSPLLSLIKDQVDQLNSKGISAEMYSGELSIERKREVIRKLSSKNIGCKILYTTPETIKSNIKFMSIMEDLYEEGKIQRIVLDEVHCLSLWGHDFRDAYLCLKDIKQQFPDLPITGATATATKTVEKDITRLLKLDNPTIFRQSFFRPNLKIKVVNITKGYSRAQSIGDIIVLLKNKYYNMTAIVYCLSRKKCEELAEKFITSGLSASAYHAGMSKKKRHNVQEKWKNDEIKIIVATVAFGMGIDKPNVRVVIHFQMPPCIENYYQEIGRGGRDGKSTDCIMYYSYRDKITYQTMFNKDSKNQSYLRHKMDKLNQMFSFSENITDCRHGILCNFLGEKRNFIESPCLHSCNNCKYRDKIVYKDVTNIAKSIITEIIDLGDYASKSNLVSRLSKRGSKLHTGSQKEYGQLVERVLVHLILTKYAKEKIEFVEQKFWQHQLVVYKKAKEILEDKTQISIPVISGHTINNIEIYSSKNSPNKISKKKIILKINLLK